MNVSINQTTLIKQLKYIMRTKKSQTAFHSAKPTLLSIRWYSKFSNIMFTGTVPEWRNKNKCKNIFLNHFGVYEGLKRLHENRLWYHQDKNITLLF